MSDNQLIVGISSGQPQSPVSLLTILLALAWTVLVSNKLGAAPGSVTTISWFFGTSPQTSPDSSMILGTALVCRNEGSEAVVGRGSPLESLKHAPDCFGGAARAGFNVSLWLYLLWAYELPPSVAPPELLWQAQSLLSTKVHQQSGWEQSNLNENFVSHPNWRHDNRRRNKLLGRGKWWCMGVYQ